MSGVIVFPVKAFESGTIIVFSPTKSTGKKAPPDAALGTPNVKSVVKTPTSLALTKFTADSNPPAEEDTSPLYGK